MQRRVHAFTLSLVLAELSVGVNGHEEGPEEQSGRNTEYCGRRFRQPLAVNTIIGSRETAARRAYISIELVRCYRTHSFVRDVGGQEEVTFSPKNDCREEAETGERRPLGTTA